MKKAVCFAGGGSKGAYQIGAWKALNELGESFDIATGTSIGSINAGFYVQHDFDAALEMWGSLKADTIMTNGINLEKSFEAIISQREQIIPFLKNYINSKGADVSPFHNMMRHYYNPQKFFASDVDYALITVKFPSMNPIEIRKADMADRENGWQWMAASAACFPVFPVMEIDGVSYVDGGYYDNVPVASAFKLGADSVVVIDLKTENNHEGYIKHPRVTYIKPTRDLGTFLNFDREVLDLSIKLGYNDTMKVYGRFYGNVYTFLPRESQKAAYNEYASVFISVLTEMEAAFDFSGSVRFQRINRYPGCTAILAQECLNGEADELHLFIAALEMFLRAVNYNDREDYELDELLFTLKTGVDGLYPMLEFDTEKAFAVVRDFIKKEYELKSSELKKYEENRYMLILTAFIRTLQRLKLH